MSMLHVLTDGKAVHMERFMTKPEAVEANKEAKTATNGTLYWAPASVSCWSNREPCYVVKNTQGFFTCQLTQEA